jgi:DNA-directed RNA polymerase sigma subunit (sigma70/sigma32)
MHSQLCPGGQAKFPRGVKSSRVRDSNSEVRAVEKPLPILRISRDADTLELQQAIHGYRAGSPEPKYLPNGQVVELVLQLPPQHGQVIARRFGLYGGPTIGLEEIAQEAGVTVSTIRNKHRKALNALRKQLMVAPAQPN